MNNGSLSISKLKLGQKQQDFFWIRTYWEGTGLEAGLFSGTAGPDRHTR